MSTVPDRPLNVIVAGWGSAGDVVPLLAVGAELKSRGHRVHAVANPAFQATAQEAGVPMITVGSVGDHARFCADDRVFGRDRSRWRDIYADHYYPHLDGFRDAIAGLAAAENTVIVGDEIAATAVADYMRLPRVQVAPSSVRFFSRHDPPHPERVFDGWTRWIPAHPASLSLFYRWHFLRHGRLHWPPPQGASFVHQPIADFRARLGLPPTSGPASLVVCLWPEWFAAPQPDWPSAAAIAGFALFPVPPPLAVLGHQRRTVVATTGTTSGDHRRFYARVTHALEHLGRPGVLVTPHAANIPARLPPEIRHVVRAPLSELFGGAALVIHHGGIGTAAWALWAGVPQIIVPMRGDQFDNGNRMVRLGVARMLSREAATTARLDRTIGEMLDSNVVTERCLEIRSRVEPREGMRRAAALIEGLAAQRPHLAQGAELAVAR
jgi:rhamnosyltransferase subunit B